MSDNEVHVFAITTKGCKCKLCEARRNKKRELARAYRLVANSMDNNDSAEKLIAEILNEKADAIERELEADNE